MDDVDKEGIAALVVATFFAILLFIAVAWFSLIKYPREMCEEANNVYFCEMTFVPAKEDNQ